MFSFVHGNNFHDYQGLSLHVHVDWGVKICKKKKTFIWSRTNFHPMKISGYIVIPFSAVSCHVLPTLIYYMCVMHVAIVKAAVFLLYSSRFISIFDPEEHLPNLVL